MYDQALHAPLFDTVLFPMDALIRLNSVASALDKQNAHPNPKIADSPLFSFIIGAIASSGGGVTAATFGVWGPEWSFTTPTFLRSSLLGTVDVWGGSFAGK